MTETTKGEEKPSSEAILNMLDIAGRRIESLDRSMMTIRQLFYVILGILAAGLTNVGRNMDLDALVILVGIGTFITSGLAYLLWRLDSHYHEYLIEAVKTCVRLEKKAGFNLKNKLGLANNLESWRKEGKSGRVIPAYFYIFPVMIGLITTAIMALVYGLVYGPENAVYLVNCYAAMAIVVILFIWIDQVQKSIQKQ